MVFPANPGHSGPRRRFPASAGAWGVLALAPALLLGAAASARAQDIAAGAGTAEFQYLDILVYARPAGLAGAYTSVAQGEDAIGYNPAGLSRLEPVRAISGTVRYHLVDVASGNVTYAFPGPSRSVCAFSAAYVNYGDIEARDENGVAAGAPLVPASFNPSLTYSRQHSDRLRLGATFKGLSEYLGDFEGSRLGLAWGLDAGILYQPAARNLGFGLALLNLGTTMESQLQGGKTGGLLPVALKGGFYYRSPEIPKARLSADLEVPWHDTPLLAGGLEYAYLPALILRAGTRFNFKEIRHLFHIATDQAGHFGGGNALKLAGGLTFQAESVGLDYAAQYWNGLSWVHAFTLRYAVP